MWNKALTIHAPKVRWGYLPQVDWYHLPAHRRSVMVYRPTDYIAPARLRWPDLLIGVLVTDDDRPRQLGYCFPVPGEPVGPDTPVTSGSAKSCLGRDGAYAVRTGRLHPVDAYFSTTFRHRADTLQDWLDACHAAAIHPDIGRRVSLRTFSLSMIYDVDRWELTF